MTVEAARSDWRADEPPAAGWVRVALPDVWTTRWPDFDGLVWYRLTWQASAHVQPVAVVLDYLNMAGAVYLNGALLSRDASLVEPLTRAWNTPRYLLLSAPLLRPGTNTLLVRVSGLAAYQPGLGPVELGNPAQIYPRYEAARLIRRDLQILSLAVSATLGAFFLTLWLMRREERAFGWFALMSFAWIAYASNQIATTVWPFTSTDAWEEADSIAFIVYCTSFSVFVLRFCERHFKRIELALWLLTALGAIVMLCTPRASIAYMRGLLAILPALLFMCSCVLFLYFAWRSRRTDMRVMSLCIVVFIVAGVHDLLTFLLVLKDNVYYTALTSQLQMVGMAVVLCWRFVTSLRRIERFNDELTITVAAAKEELAATLSYQHKLEVSNARLGERLSLAQDLHDGLGGTLVGSIATLEHMPNGIPPDRFLAILKELRDDLRIIVDAASSHRLGEDSLAEVLAPVRQRLMRALEIQGVACRWDAAGIERSVLPSALSLDVLRIVQEGVTNVIKHARASRVDVTLHDDGEALHLVIADNGIGFAQGAADPATHRVSHGAGMRSMHARAERLGATLQAQSGTAGTTLKMRMPNGARRPPGGDPRAFKRVDGDS